MKSTAIFLIAAVFACQGLTAEPIIGDRHPAIHCVYPSDLLFHHQQGGWVFDVTQPPYNLRGDGQMDCTAGLIQLYDDILDRAENAGSGWGNPGPDYTFSPVIYFPRGTYLVSDTIVYSGQERAGWNLVSDDVQQSLGRKPSEHGAWDFLRGGVPGLDFTKIKQTDVKNFWEHVARIRFVGESRDQTIIRLADNATGFGAGGRKPILSFGKSHFNNHVAMNAVRNLTIDSGTGNPGAVGIHFNGANVCDISNVTIQSGDGRGAAGIDVLIPPTQGYHSNITIDGFDYGINLLAYHVTHPVFEYVTLRNQRKAGIYVGSSSTSIRGLRSVNQVPALIVDSTAGQATLIDSRLEAVAANVDAIVVNKGSAVLRNIRTQGYRKAIATHDSPYVDEVVIGTTLPEGARTLALPIEEAPLITWQDDPSEWACVKEFGAVGDNETDDTGAIQQAMNSGKSAIYFPPGRYLAKGQITVPETVKWINGMSHRIRMKLVVDEPSTTPLYVSDAILIQVDQAAKRPVVMSRLIFSSVHSTGDGFRPKFHILGCSACGIKDAQNMDIWCRFINPEGHYLPLTAGVGTRLWIMGYKTERGGNMGRHDLKVVQGGQLEVLGGISGVTPQGLLVNENGDVSITMVTSANGYLEKHDIDAIIEDFPSGKRVLYPADLPTRSPDKDQVPQGLTKPGDLMLPLYRHTPD